MAGLRQFHGATCESDDVRNPALRLLPFVAVFAIVALLPIYSVHSVTDSFPRHPDSYPVVVTTYVTFVEVVGGGFAWQTEERACGTDGWRVTRYWADSPLIAEYAWLVAILSLLLFLGLIVPRTEVGRRATLLVVAIALLALASRWLVWYGLIALPCVADFGAARGVAAALTAASLAVGAVLVAFHNRLARESWRWASRGSSGSP